MADTESFEMNATPEDVATATLAALRSAAQAHYVAMNFAVSAAKLQATPANHIEWIKTGYDAVIATLPEGSPFVRPLKRYQEMAIEVYKNPGKG